MFCIEKHMEMFSQCSYHLYLGDKIWGEVFVFFFAFQYYLKLFEFFVISIYCLYNQYKVTPTITIKIGPTKFNFLKCVSCY